MVGRIEEQTRKYLTNDPAGFPSIDRVREILHASAADSYATRAAFYRSQPGFCNEWLEEAVEETVAITLEVLVPPVLRASRAFLEAKPRIKAALNKELTEGSSDVAIGPAPLKRQRGRPTEIPSQRKELALEAKRRGAGGREIAKILYATPYPSPRQVKNQHNILKYHERKHPDRSKKSE